MAGRGTRRVGDELGVALVIVLIVLSLLLTIAAEVAAAVRVERITHSISGRLSRRARGERGHDPDSRAGVLATGWPGCFGGSRRRASVVRVTPQRALLETCATPETAVAPISVITPFRSP